MCAQSPKMDGAMPNDLMAAEYGTATHNWRTATCGGHVTIAWAVMHEGGGDWVLQFPMPWYVGQ